VPEIIFPEYLLQLGTAKLADTVFRQWLGLTAVSSMRAPMVELFLLKQASHWFWIVSLQAMQKFVALHLGAQAANPRNPASSSKIFCQRTKFIIKLDNT
jgi:hypothetical protein